MTPAPTSERALYLDAFRGFTMVGMVSAGFGFRHFADHPVWGAIARQFEHVAWEGLVFYDLIQPFFMFIVGVVMPFAFERRWAHGETWSQSLKHVLRRAALLILFGLLARSIQAGKPTLDLINVLAQVAFTYVVAFLLLRQSWKVQGAVALSLLVLHWALFQFSGFPEPWARGTNFGAWLDMQILGKTWGGGYVTVNALSSAGNTIFGVMAGRLMASTRPAGFKLRVLLATGIGSIILGLLLSPWVPLVKKIWTASFTIYSTGFTLLAMAAFYFAVEMRGWQRWPKLFIIVGANSIFIYLFHEILGRWISQTGLVFTGWAVNWWGPGGHLLNAWLGIAFQLWTCVWLYRRRIFFKI